MSAAKAGILLLVAASAGAEQWVTSRLFTDENCTVLETSSTAAVGSCTIGLISVSVEGTNITTNTYEQNMACGGATTFSYTVTADTCTPHLGKYAMHSTFTAEAGTVHMGFGENVTDCSGNATTSALFPIDVCYKAGDVYQKFECDGEMLKITGYDAMGCSVAAPTAETFPAQGSYARDSCVASAMKIGFTTCTTSGGGTGDASAAPGVYSHAVLVALGLYASLSNL